MQAVLIAVNSNNNTKVTKNARKQTLLAGQR